MKVTVNVAQEQPKIYNGNASTWPNGVYVSQRNKDTVIIVSACEAVMFAGDLIDRHPADLCDGYIKQPAGTSVTVTM